MAAITHLSSTTSTANTNIYPSSAFTPTAGRLLFVMVAASDTVTAAPTLTETTAINGHTFTLVDSALEGSNDTLYLYVADQLTPAGPAATTIRFNCTGDNATGTVIGIGEVSGMTRVGLDAILQHAKVNGVPFGTPPATTFTNAVLTGNPTAFFTINLTIGVTPPTGWTERLDTSYATPPTGASYHSRDSGYTGTLITLGSVAGNSAAIAVEFNVAAAPSGAPSGDLILTASPSGVVLIHGTALQTEYATGLTPATVTGVLIKGTHKAGITVPPEPPPAPGEAVVVQNIGTPEDPEWVEIDVVQIVGAVKSVLEIAQYVEGEWVVLGD